MQYVLDTNVVSALRVRGRNPSVEAWALSMPVTDQFVTATIMAEIERDVVAKERSDPARGHILRRWFDDRVLPAFADRVLPFDLAAARVLATYRVPEHAPLDDGLIAAIAHAAGMTVATPQHPALRTVRHRLREPVGGARRLTLRRGGVAWPCRRHRRGTRCVERYAVFERGGARRSRSGAAPTPTTSRSSRRSVVAPTSTGSAASTDGQGS